MTLNEPTSNNGDKAIRFRMYHLYLCLFLFSGTAGLIYEVLWVRQFTVLFGASTYAVTIVLTSFMLGLGLGAWVIGKLVDSLKENRLMRLYVTIEIAIGAYALLLPFALKWAETVYVHFYQIYHPGPLVFYGFKVALACLLLVVPTTLIGATFPVMSRYVISEKKMISIKVSQLYAANTIGAIIGTLMTGYFLLPSFGIRFTNLIAIGLNFLVAAVVLSVNSLSATKKSGTTNEAVTANGPCRLTKVQRMIVRGFCLSGAAAMFYEVAWTRTLSMILGTTTYAFTTMLAAFLLGIGLGSLVYRWIPTSVPRIWLFSILQAIIGFSALLTIPFFEKLPFLFLSFHMRWVNTWVDLQLMRFLLTLLVMIVPTLAMGILFPVVGSLFIERTTHIGSRLGKAYAWNTIGAAAGAALAGLVIVPFFGMQKTIMVGGIVNLAVGLGVYLFRSDFSLKRRVFLSTGSALALTILLITIAPWAPKIMNSGPYMYASQYEAALERYRTAAEQTVSTTAESGWGIWEMAMDQYELLYYKTGIMSTVAVMERNDGVRFLTINGKTDASTGMKSDLRTQVMIAQIPLIFHEKPDEVLVVGLGSGITVGSVLTHDIREVDCAEISPAVIEAANFFADANHHALDDKRLRIIPQDARNMLLISKKSYDVIISQPSNPWIKGESSLFSVEWYNLVHEHLRRGGLFLQWVPAYLMADTDLKIIIHTLRSIFPHLTLWSSGSAGDLILLARKGLPLRVDYNLLNQNMKHDNIRRDIFRTGIDPNLFPFQLFVMNGEKISDYLYSGLDRPLGKNTDDHLLTEFSTPKRITRARKVNRFLDPEGIHGDRKDLLAITDHIEKGELLRMLDGKCSGQGTS